MEDVIIGRAVVGKAEDDEEIDGSASTSLDGAEFGVFSEKNCR